MQTWIIGAGGLLGSALQRHAASPFQGTSVPWHDPDATLNALEHDLDRFGSSSGDMWSIMWAAGSATTASNPEHAARELRVFRRFAEKLRLKLPKGSGSLFVASSAGGIYASGSHPPFAATSTPHPVGAYGELKLAQEQIACELLSSAIPVVIGRFANLYGIGQRFDKTQGLISTLVRAAFTRQTVNIFVPIDTMRDYIFTDDAAQVALHWATQAADLGSDGSQIRVIASGDARSIGSIIATVGDVTRLRIPIALGSHPSSKLQARDLRLIPDEDSGTRTMQRTPLPVGIKLVSLDLMARIQQPNGTRN